MSVSFTNKEWFNTRFVLQNFLMRRRSKAHSMLSNPAKAMINGLKLKNQNITDSEAFSACAFMNYYQRPTIDTNNTINNTQSDNDYAFHVFMEVCSIIQPKLVLFLSKKAFGSFEEYRTDNDDVFVDSIITSFPHPTCSHWNDEDGKQKFEAIIKDNVDFKDFRSYKPLKKEAVINAAAPYSFKYIEKGQRRFQENQIRMKIYFKNDEANEIVIHTKSNGRCLGIGYLVAYKCIWIWDYDKNDFISESAVTDYPGLEDMYMDFCNFIESL